MFAILAALLLTSGGDHAEDLKKLEGTWIAVSWQWGDDLRTEEGGFDLRYEIKGDEVTSRGKGGGSFAMKDGSTRPAAGGMGGPCTSGAGGAAGGGWPALEPNCER